jgi:hypothetical protein
MPCAETHLPLEDLEGLADLADLEHQERLRDPLQQYLRQSQQEETPTIGLWETYPKYLTESERTPEHSSTLYLGTSERMQESLASIHPYEKYPSCSPSSKDHK